MNDPSQTIKPDIQAYKILLVDLHRLIADGKSDSEEADDTRDRLLDIWRRLSDDEIAWLDGVSADLFMLQNDEVFETPTTAADCLEHELSQAVDREDWERALKLLRQGTPLRPDESARIRSVCYQRLQHADLAALFAEHALKLQSNEPSITRA